jgi:hypothetical protein
MKKTKTICLNQQTAANLIAYLQTFPPEAKVTIWHDYKTYDCQICCNTEHQQKTQTAMLMLGQFVANG